MQNNLYNHFYIPGNLLNSVALTKLQTQLIYLCPRILLVNLAFPIAETAFYSRPTSSQYNSTSVERKKDAKEPQQMI